MSNAQHNLLVIMADDHAAHAVGSLGNRTVATPNLDGLAAQGVSFRNAVCPSPMCTPSRQAVLTGRIPSAIGVPHLTSAMPDGTYTLAHHLVGAGYRTAAIGKMHFNSDLHHGFQQRIDREDYEHHLRGSRTLTYEAWPGGRPWKPFVQPARTWLNAAVEPAPQQYAESEAAFFVDQARDYFRERAQDQSPFALWLSFYEPHSPFVFPEDNAASFTPDDIVLPHVTEEDRARAPAIFSDLTDRERRGVVAAYYSSIAHLDRAIGNALDALHEAGLDGNTMVVYVADHGSFCGQHDRFEKHSLLEEAIRVPCIVRAPWTPARGIMSEQMVQSTDIAPTVCDLLKLRSLPTSDGVSFAPALIDGRTSSSRTAAYAEYLHTESAMWRTDRWKLIVSTGELEDWYYPARPGARPALELYDLRDDPDETVNLAGEDSKQSTVRELADSLNVFIRDHSGMRPTATSHDPIDQIRNYLRFYRLKEEGRL